MLDDETLAYVTQTGPGTPMGNLFRRFWTPCLMSSEVDEADGTPVRVKVLGEDLIAFRDSNGVVGLIDAYCAHRGAPLFFGRNEDCGLRCIYHGWKYDVNGACVDMPNEPVQRPHQHDGLSHQRSRRVGVRVPGPARTATSDAPTRFHDRAARARPHGQRHRREQLLAGRGR